MHMYKKVSEHMPRPDSDPLTSVQGKHCPGTTGMVCSSVPFSGLVFRKHCNRIVQGHVMHM